MLSRIFVSALFAGAAAGLIAALLQIVFVQPVLLHAELYESGVLTHFGGATPAPVQPQLPGFDVLRDGLSIVFTMLIYTGYALFLTAGMAIAEENGAELSWRRGILWGIAGFVAFHLAPAFSLPPEVPGSAAADVGVRQIWWFATVAMALGACWLIAFVEGLWALVAAALLLLAPHIYGAPLPAQFTSPVPGEISALFAARALGVGFAAWSLLGAFAAYFWQREPA